MKRIAILYALFFLLVGVPAFSQKSRKLTKEESAKLTQDQRVVHESSRKSKNGKKTLSMKKKIKIDRKQDRKSRRIKQPKRKN